MKFPDVLCRRQESRPNWQRANGFCTQFRIQRGGAMMFGFGKKEKRNEDKVLEAVRKSGLPVRETDINDPAISPEVREKMRKEGVGTRVLVVGEATPGQAEPRKRV